MADNVKLRAVGNEEEQPNQKKGKFYWFVQNTFGGIFSFIKNNKWKLIFLVPFVLLVLFVVRPYYHSFVLMLRKQVILFIIGLPIFLLTKHAFKNGTWKMISFMLLLYAGIGYSLYNWGGMARDYLALYFQHESLHIVEPTEPPTTDHERIQPRYAVFSAIRQNTSDNNYLAQPNFVRRKSGNYDWTFGMEPAFPADQILGGVDKVLAISGTSALIDSPEDRMISVDFSTGEKLKLGKNIQNSVIRSLSFWRFFNYESSGVLYIEDDAGVMVQVVPFVRWKGIFFPRQEFGGVQVIRQGGGDFVSLVKQTLFGKGEFIKPEDITKYPFLKGQNVLSVEASRYIAKSFAFQAGFLAPLTHRNDIIIPDVPDDRNRQPFTGYFNVNAKDSGLYHSYSLEPYDLDKQGLNTSLLIPADGRLVDGKPLVFAYRHSKNGESYIGSSAVSSIIKASKRQYDWDNNSPIEGGRPYIKFVGGKVRRFFMATVVTNTTERYMDDKDDKKIDEKANSLTKSYEQSTAGNIPEVVLVDARDRIPVWVDSLRPETWVAQLEKELGPIWEKKEKK